MAHITRVTDNTPYTIERNDHASRTANFHRVLNRIVGADKLTVAHVHALAAPHVKSAHALREKARAGSPRHRYWRYAALVTARAYYAVARQLPTGVAR